MARVSRGKHATQITGTNDPTKQISKDKWNEDHTESGMLGFTAANKTIAAGVLTPTDSVTIVAGEGGAADDLDYIEYGAGPEINDKDILILFSGSQTITVRHNQGTPGTNQGAIILLGATNKVLSTTVPTILMRVDNTFYEISANNLITNAQISTSAAITLSKLAALTASKALVSDASGVISASTVTSTEVEYLSGVTSAIQTQLDAKVNLTGAQTVSDKDITVTKRVTNDITSITYSATTDFDLNNNEVQTLSLTGNVTFTTSNRASGKHKTVKILCDGTQRTLTFPSWKFVGSAAPTNIDANKTAILTITCFGANDTDIVAAYTVEP